MAAITEHSYGSSPSATSASAVADGDYAAHEQAYRGFLRLLRTVIALHALALVLLAIFLL
ncbi:aa3-type cytochrome c oxidase subunit IV [Chelatococcus reniformis]|uniref:Cytochrome c oxidase subunit IV bacterial aa3 type domain-containing protein n=1 Tax=Chelatococcus reniformis TaxID=1494448 RepID=A0A916ULR5_9HYPH|nr:aa3-type cytochrome c oxidase subunit IV [Chelatococcus reniformis]GGC76776.1 hypothetical protein GCM10010994_38840 [Chelatococcus reniformis]